MIIAGTGSRELRADEELFEKVIVQVESFLQFQSMTQMQNLTLMSGMAEGFDEIIAKVARELSVPLICSIPNRGYLEYYWKKNSVTGFDRYKEAEALCNYAESSGGYVKYICKDLYVDGVHANFVRNNWMVDNSEYMLVYNPVSRGTSHCYSYIKQVGRSHHIIEVPK